MLSELQIADHTDAWLNAHRDFLALTDIANSVDLQNAKTKDKEIASIIDFSKSAADQLMQRRKKDEEFQKEQTIKDEEFEINILSKDAVEAYDRVQSLKQKINKEKNEKGDILRESGKATNSEIQIYRTQESTTDIDLIELRTKAAMSDLGPFLKERLDNPNHVWTMPDGTEFTKENWTDAQMKWAWEQSLIDHFRTNKHINLLDVNKVFLTPYGNNIKTARDAFFNKNSNAISDRDGRKEQILQMDILLKEDDVDLQDVGAYFDSVIHTTVNGVPLGRVEGFELFKKDLIARVGTLDENGKPLLTRKKALELIQDAKFKYIWKGSGKTLAEEYPTRYGPDSVEGQAILNELQQAEEKAWKQKTDVNKLSINKDIDAFLESECGGTYSAACQAKAVELKTKGDNIQGYSTRRISDWMSRAESQPSDVWTEHNISILQSAAEGDFLTKGQVINGRRVEEIIASLPHKHRADWYKELDKNRILDSDGYRKYLPGKSTVQKILEHNIGQTNDKLVGNQVQASEMLNKLYTKRFKIYHAAGADLDEAGSKASEEVRAYGMKNSEDGGIFWTADQGDAYGQFPYLGKEGTAFTLNEKDDRLKYSRKIRENLKRGKEFILNSKSNLIATESQLIKFQESYNKKSDYRIPDWLRLASLELEENPIYIVNRLLEARGINKVVDDPISTWFSARKVKLQKQLQRNLKNGSDAFLSSARVLGDGNKNGLNMDTVPYKEYWEGTPPEQLPYALALLESVNKDSGTNKLDINDIKEVLDQWNDPDTGFNGDGLWDALSQIGIVDMDQYNQCFYKYATKDQYTPKTICFRSSMKKILQNQ